MVHTRPDGTISKDNTSFTAAQYILHEQCIDALHIKSLSMFYSSPWENLILDMGKLDPVHEALMVLVAIDAVVVGKYHIAIILSIRPNIPSLHHTLLSNTSTSIMTSTNITITTTCSTATSQHDFFHHCYSCFAGSTIRLLILYLLYHSALYHVMRAITTYYQG